MLARGTACWPEPSPSSRRYRARTGRRGESGWNTSGLPDQQLSGAIRCAVAKININTELRQAYLAAIRTVRPTVLSTHDSVAFWRAGREAVTTAAVRSIHTLASSHQGSPPHRD